MMTSMVGNPQIVYLVVNCVANSNFSALYASIGNAIDRALGITTSVYQKLIESRRSLGEKAEKVRELVEIFAIGIIILDEIQLIDFQSTKENSFESLMTLLPIERKSLLQLSVQRMLTRKCSPTFVLPADLETSYQATSIAKIALISAFWQNAFLSTSGLIVRSK